MAAFRNNMVFHHYVLPGLLLWSLLLNLFLLKFEFKLLRENYSLQGTVLSQDKQSVGGILSTSEFQLPSYQEKSGCATAHSISTNKMNVLPQSKDSSLQFVIQDTTHRL